MCGSTLQNLNHQANNVVIKIDKIDTIIQMGTDTYTLKSIELGKAVWLKHHVLDLRLRLAPKGDREVGWEEHSPGG